MQIKITKRYFLPVGIILKLIAVLLCLYFVPLFAHAQDNTDAFHESVSASIAATANFLDDFFVNERRNVEGSKSQVVLSYLGTADHKFSFAHQYYVNARLHLPKTENRFRLLIQNSIGYESETEQTGLGVEGSPIDTETQYSAALQYVFAESRLWQVSTRAGLSLGIPIDPFFRFRVRRLIQFTLFDSRITQEFYWSESEQFIEKSALDLERLISPIHFARMRFEITWGEIHDDFVFINSLALFKKLKSNIAVKYETGYQGIVEPQFDLQRVYLNMRYRRNIHKKWMFYEVVPELYRDESNWRDTKFQLVFKLDFVFGKVL